LVQNTNPFSLSNESVKSGQSAVNCHIFTNPVTFERTHLKTILALLCILSLAGCAELLKLQGQAAEKTAQGVGYVCSNTDTEFRGKFVDEVNEKAAPNSIQIVCGVKE